MASMVAQGVQSLAGRLAWRADNLQKANLVRTIKIELKHWGFLPYFFEAETECSQQTFEYVIVQMASYFKCREIKCFYCGRFAQSLNL